MDRNGVPHGVAHTREGGLGVLLVNLGTPDAPTAPALRRYLAEFLSDPDVVALPRILWLPLLHGLVLRTRPARSAEAYGRIWTKAGSPLLVNSQALADKLEAALGPGFKLALGMRYGNPSLSSAITALKEAGVTRLLVLPLYPQYAEATTGSTLKAVDRALKRLGWASAVTAIRDYHDQPAYVAALAESVKEHWDAHGRGRTLLISFHGIPKLVSDKGDPYAGHCAETARLLAERLDLKEREWRMTFQSRFGPAEWLKPYTEETLKECAAQGLARVDVICPGFAADCLETLEEIALRYAESFRAAGGKELHYIPALNARDAHVRTLAELVLQQQHERA
jgi:protoporphyrin/coproporphyrin ferrochelatase